MSYMPLLFWFALLLPGYALVRRFWPEEEKSGLLGVIGLAYVVVLGILSPVSIVGYWVGLPVWVLSAACVVVILAGIVELFRKRWWGGFGRLLLVGVCVETLIVAGDMALSARVGTHMGGDAAVHLARIRFLLDNGLNNLDPYVGDYFFTLYHTNIIHSLHAACSQITGADHLAVWFVSLAWAKLLIASGTYYLAWTVFRSRWPALVAVVFVVGMHGPLTFNGYPNKLAALWLWAITIAFGIQACRKPNWKTLLKLVCGALLLGQTHALYGGFAIVLMGPVLGVAALMHTVRRRSLFWPALACSLALTASLPFALAAMGKSEEAPGPDGMLAGLPVAEPGVVLPPPKEREVDGGADANTRRRAAAVFHELEDGSIVRRLNRGTAAVKGPTFRWLVLGVVCGLLGARRKEVAWLTAVLAVAYAILYTPALCTAAVSVLGQKWILLRMEIVVALAFPVLGPAALAYSIERHISSRRVCVLLSIAALLLALPYKRHGETWNWSQYVGLATLPPDHRHSIVDALRESREILRTVVPPGERVLAPTGLGMTLAEVYDCRLMVADRSSAAVPDLSRRRTRTKFMLGTEYTHPVRRQKLLEGYGIRYVFTSKLSEWLAPRVTLIARLPMGNLYLLVDDEGVDQAIVLLRRLVQRSPDDPELRSRLARWLFVRERWDETLVEMRAVCELAPEDGLAASRLGDVLLRLERWEDALAAYDAAVRNDPDYTEARFKRAMALVRLGRAEEAVEGFRAHLSLHPLDVQARFLLGRLLYMLGRTQEAIEQWQRVLQIDPNHEQSRDALQQVGQRP